MVPKLQCTSLLRWQLSDSLSILYQLINRSELAFILKSTGYNEQVSVVFVQESNGYSIWSFLCFLYVCVCFFSGTMSVERCCGLNDFLLLCVFFQNNAWISLMNQKYVGYCPHLSIWKTFLRLHNSTFLNFGCSSALGRYIFMLCCTLYFWV